MKKLSLCFIIIILIVSCNSKKVDNNQKAIKMSVDYVESLGNRDINVQSKLLSEFEIDLESYNKNFLSYVRGTKLIENEIVNENSIIITVKIVFQIEMSGSFNENSSLKKGNNIITRYLTFYKNDEMKLKEIYDKLIK